jgi:TatD DNase family protein
VTPAVAHCHLDRAGGAAALHPATGGAVLAVTVLPRHWRTLRRIHHPRVTWALGLHPAEPHTTRDLDELLDALQEADAIGEIGLDGTPGAPVPLARQRAELDRILAHPAARDRLVSIHSRLAAKPLIEHLAAARLPAAVLHWFTGTPRQAEAAADTGAWFSVNAAMSRRLDALRAIPADRLLVETDAPYAGHRSAPGNVDGAVAAVAAAWDIAAVDAARRVAANERTLAAVLARDPFALHDQRSTT